MQMVAECRLCPGHNINVSRASLGSHTFIHYVYFFSFSLKYPRRRRLYYLYPPPSPSILANISNALAACPKLYVQVHACAFVSVPLCLFCKCVFVNKQTVLGGTIPVNAAFVPSGASLSSSSGSSA